MLLKEAHLFIHILLIIENEISRKHQVKSRKGLRYNF